MPLPKIVTQYEYEKFETPGIAFPASDPKSRSKAIQSDMDAADINKIMARFEKTGVIIDASGAERQPVYGDFTGIKDYHGMLSAVRNAERVFGLYPANLRNKFDNDPQKFIDFMEDPKNDAEAIKLGLKLPPAVNPNDPPSGQKPPDGTRPETPGTPAPGAPATPPA